MDCPETSVTTNLHCVTSQKIEYLIYTAADAWNHAWRHLHRKSRWTVRAVTTVLRSVQAMCEYCGIASGVSSLPYFNYVSLFWFLLIFYIISQCLFRKLHEETLIPSESTTNSLSTIIISVISYEKTLFASVHYKCCAINYPSSQTFGERKTKLSFISMTEGVKQLKI
jgi:hypothetical protein